MNTNRHTESVEVILKDQRRRRWSPAEKAALVKRTYEPGMSVSLVARLTLYPFQYHSEVETSGFSDIAVAACRQQPRANSAGVAHSSAEWGRLSL